MKFHRKIHKLVNGDKNAHDQTSAFSIFQFVLAAVLAVAAAAPSRSYEAPTYAPKVYQILKQEAELRDDQSYDSQ